MLAWVSPSALLMCGRNQNFDVSMTNFIDGWLPLKRAWELEYVGFDTGFLWSNSICGSGLCRSCWGAPLTNSTGISVSDPETGPFCALLLFTSCKCPRFVFKGFSRLCLLLHGFILESSLKEPGSMDSGKSASSPVKERLLWGKKKEEK